MLKIESAHPTLLSPRTLSAFFGSEAAGAAGAPPPPLAATGAAAPPPEGTEASLS